MLASALSTKTQALQQLVDQGRIVPDTEVADWMCSASRTLGIEHQFLRHPAAGRPR